MTDDALLRDLLERVGDMQAQLVKVAVEQAEQRSETQAFKDEYLDGKKASMHRARVDAGFQASTRDVLSEVQLRTQKTAIEVTESRKDIAEVHTEARITNGRMTKAEARLDLIEASLETSKWRWRAFVGLVVSVTSGLVLLGAGLLIR